MTLEKHHLTETDHMVSVRMKPWHGLGTIVDHAMTSAEALEAAKLDWTVIQSPAQYETNGETREVPNMFVNHRSDNNDSLGVVSDRYNIVQNSQAFEFTDHLVGEGCRYKTAGSVKGGRKIWLLANLPEKVILDDIVIPYLLFTNSHDGKSAVTVCMTPTRVVCNNTINIALRDATRKWSVSHYRDVHKLIDAKQTLQLSANYMDDLVKEADQLATEKVSTSDLRNFIESMFPDNNKAVQNNYAKREIERFHACYEQCDVANFKGTKWGLILAVSDFITHAPIRNSRHQQSHFIKTSEGHPILDKAYQIIASM